MNSLSLPVETITVFQLKDLLNTEACPLILDVRELEELKICSLPTFIHIPLGQLMDEKVNLCREQMIVTVCHHGYRSLQAATMLKTSGFRHVFNLAGGLHAWARDIDLTMQQY